MENKETIDMGVEDGEDVITGKEILDSAGKGNPIF